MLRRFSRKGTDMAKENLWKLYTKKQCDEAEQVAASYRAFLNAGKTERECVKEAVRQAEAAGFTDLAKICAENHTLHAGDKVYAVCKNKTVALFVLGERPMCEGMRILGAHIDSPRLDIKQNPLYEDTELAYLDTHYYGGVKKYQWVTIPLSLHGVVAKKDGTVVEVCIGEDENDPVLCITDLLIHLAAQQLEKKGRVVIEGENLDVLVGSRPLSKAEGSESEADESKAPGGGKKDQPDEDGTKDAVKENILEILKEKYGMEEDEFFSAELEIVPAEKARDCGLDRSMILGYGQDDRVCAYTSLAALLEIQNPQVTCCCLLVDKEEIGSVGATSMRSHFLENTVAELMNCAGQYSELNVRRCLNNSRMLSSDVSAAYDPLYGSAFEKKNSAYFGRGMVFNKFTGAGGKSNSNDADAEYLGWVRKVLEDAGVLYQTSEVGRVDAGGGGTIAFICALYGMEVVDCGVPVLSMHAPMEIVSKADVYETKRGYLAFLRA